VTGACLAEIGQRLDPQFLNAGLGFGGPRLPHDIRALCRLADRIGVDFGMLKEAERINQQRVDRFLASMQRALWVIKDKCIGFLGLAAKPDTDDIRSSPAIELLRRLIAEGAQVRAYDPQALAKAQAEFPQLTTGASAYEAAEGADAPLIATEWNDFRELDWKRRSRCDDAPPSVGRTQLAGPPQDEGARIRVPFSRTA
jgi:UDPglucose 6-dehydrogenase